VRLRRDRPDLRVVPLDLSFGMTPEVAGDLQALPLADDCVDGATPTATSANSMSCGHR